MSGPRACTTRIARLSAARPGESRRPNRRRIEDSSEESRGRDRQSGLGVSDPNFTSTSSTYNIGGLSLDSLIANADLTITDKTLKLRGDARVEQDGEFVDAALAELGAALSVDRRSPMQK